jgi:hypothetical protein
MEHIVDDLRNVEDQYAHQYENLARKVADLLPTGNEVLAELGCQEFVLEEASHSSCERRARNSRLDEHLGPQSVNFSILAILSQQTSLMLVLNDVSRSGSFPGTQDMIRSHSCTRSEEICHRTPLPTFEPTKRRSCQDRYIELQELPKRVLRSHRLTES